MTKGARDRRWPRGLLAASLWLVRSVLPAQDYTWWNEANNWDGVTHWSRYINFSPYYLGPDGLPVPPLATGTIDTTARLMVGGELHFSEGDDTQALQSRLSLPFAGDRVALQLEWMPLEHFAMDTVTRDERHARDRDGEGYSTGDVHLSTLVQVLRERDDRPGLMLRIRLKTASGGNLEAARHTDDPGYGFDLSTGRWFTGSGLLQRWRVQAMAGFLVYQTNRNDYYQNDCVLFGAGAIADLGDWTVEGTVAGYMGYLDRRDRPMVLRASVGTDRPHGTEHRLMLQGPLKDWTYTSISYTVGLRLGGRVFGTDRER